MRIVSLDERGSCIRVDKLKNGINFHVIPTEKYKTVRMMMRFSAPLSVETISKRTLLASMLETSSKKYNTQLAVSEKLADMYGASYGINVGKKGQTHYLSVIFNSVNGKYLPNEEDVISEGISFVKEMLFNPAIEAGEFDKDTFYREQKNLQEYIASVSDDKQSLASLKLQEVYFSEDDNQKYPSFGTIEEVGKETPASLAAYYTQMLAEDTVDIFVIGDVSAEKLRHQIDALPFGERSEVTEQAFYSQEVKKEVIIKEETYNISQAKLNLAYNTNCYYYDQDYFAMQIFNGLFGGFPHSKLFMNVREKESMAYYASSSLDTFRGLLTVQTGIDGQNRERVELLIQEQLISLVRGEISEDELSQTKEMLKNHYFLSLDNPAAVIEAAFLQEKLPQSNITADEWVEKLEAVTIEDIQKVADKVTLQATYIMTGGAE